MRECAQNSHAIGCPRPYRRYPMKNLPSRFYRTRRDNSDQRRHRKDRVSGCGHVLVDLNFYTSTLSHVQLQFERPVERSRSSSGLRAEPNLIPRSGGCFELLEHSPAVYTARPRKASLPSPDKGCRALVHQWNGTPQCPLPITAQALALGLCVSSPTAGEMAISELPIGTSGRHAIHSGGRAFNFKAGAGGEQSHSGQPQHSGFCYITVAQPRMAIVCPTPTGPMKAMRGVG